MHRSVLILTHEFPPSAGGGVQRIASFARHLPDAGWACTIVSGTVDPKRPMDDTLGADLAAVPVVRVAAFDPRRFAATVLSPFKRRRAASAQTPATGGVAGRPAASRRAPVSTRVASWLGVPDHAAPWIRPATRAAVEAGRRSGASVVFASGPPHSVLVAGARAARRLGVPFVADMRDAWRDNPSSRYPTPLHRARARALERAVMHAAVAVTCASEPIASEARAMGARRTLVVPNGFEPGDLPSWRPAAGAPRLAFMGTMYSPVTDPRPLLEAMRALGDAGQAEAISLDVIGTPAPFAVAEAAELGLDDRVRFLGYRSHREALDLVAEADAGVVLVNDTTPGARSVYTGKLFEYLGMGIPILLLAPADGVAASLVEEARAGLVVPYSDIDACAMALRRIGAAKRAGEPVADPDPVVVARFDRRAQALVLAGVLDDVAGLAAQ